MGRALPSLIHSGRPDAIAIASPEGPTLTYAELREQVRGAADGLASFGLGPGDRVALVFPPGPEAIVAFLAAASASTAAPLNPGFTEDEFRYFLRDVGARALLVPPDAPEAVRRACPPGVRVLEARLADGALRLEGQEPRRAREASEPASEDVALLLHSSGTTGRPKRVALRHRNLVASVDDIVATYELGPDDATLAVMPLFHVHGLVAAVLATLASGGTVVVPARFNPASLPQLVREHRITWYTAVPTLHQLALARAKPDGRGSLRFIRSASAKLPMRTLAALEARFDAPVIEAYGMTEASHQIASNPLPPRWCIAGSVGFGRSTRVRIVDERGRTAPPMSQGEVLIQGPNVIERYDDDAEADAGSFVAGWFRTGDVGILDDAGYLMLTGRVREMINRAGEKVMPHEVEEVLTKHPAVVEAACFGVPHELLGEEVAAAVVLRRPVPKGELLRHCREHLAAFKVPKHLHIVERIPRTAVGKVSRVRLAQQLGAAA